MICAELCYNRHMINNIATSATMNATSSVYANVYTCPVVQQEIKDRLHEETLCVSFTKKDGERRDMECTLQPNLLPARASVSSVTRSAASNLAVYDVNAGGWRSFCWDSVLSVTAPNTNKDTNEHSTCNDALEIPAGIDS